MAAYCADPPDDPFAVSRSMFDALAGELAGPAASGLTAFELEELLDESGREVIRQLLQDHLDLRAAREEQQAREQRAPAAGPDGITRTRLETGHGRLLSTLFGTVTVTRCAWRAPGAPNYRPADAALSLPAGRHSRSLAKLAATEAARGSFDAAHAAIARRCGNVIGKRQLEQSVTAAAADIPAFYAARVPEPCAPETLLVLSADGIVMRPGALRAATAKAAARLGKMRTRLSAGEKPNRKRMACLVTVYDAEPAERRPHDVIAPPGGRHGSRKPRPGPKALAKWLAGSVRSDPAEVIAAAFDEAEARDPGHRRTWVVLVDGAEHQLDLIRAEAARRNAGIHVVIDLIRVLELHLEGGLVPARRRRPRRRGLGRRQGTRGAGRRQRPGRRGDHRPGRLRRPARQPAPTPASATSAPGTSTSVMTRPSQTAGPSPPALSREPAGTSADRLDIGGARWGLDGAEAVLTLRAVISNGDFEEYWRFHLEREHQRLYPGIKQGQYALSA